MPPQNLCGEHCSNNANDGKESAPLRHWGRDLTATAVGTAALVASPAAAHVGPTATSAPGRAVAAATSAAIVGSTAASATARRTR
jgi:hypothetical protein